MQVKHVFILVGLFLGSSIFSNELCFAADQSNFVSVSYEIWGHSDLVVSTDYDGRGPGPDLVDTEVGLSTDFEFVDNTFLSGGVTFNFDKTEVDTDPLQNESVKEAFFSLGKDEYLFGFGRTEYATNLFEISTAHELGFNSVFQRTVISGKEVFFGRTGIGGYEFLFSIDDSNSDSQGRNYDVIDSIIITNINSFEISYAVQSIDAKDKEIDSFAQGLSLKTFFDNVILGLAYSDSDDYSIAQSTVAYQKSNRTLFSIGVDIVKELEKSAESYWYSNYRFLAHRNIKVYTEIGNSPINDDFSYLLGAEFQF